ncbi:MAG: DUF3575 domain-containing protein [Prevotella sp.]|nr:DUF3575 domain-containing protein [Candidatus Prevotella equi]
MGMLLLLLFMMPAASLRAQVFDNSRQVDTLSIAERISIRTNLVDWGLTVPNIGVEFDLRKENWNRYAVGINLRYRPRTSGTYVRPFVFNLFEATLEGRHYWHERKAEPSGYLKRHRHWIDKVFSCRTMMPSHPRWIFYRGGYVSYSDFSMLLGNNGWQGQAILAGFTWGFIKPFVAFQNGNSIDLEFGFSAGIGVNKYDNYTINEYTNCYPRTGTHGWGFIPYPVVREIRAGFVYRLGNYPIQKKYRWRYDVDMDYRNKRDSIYNAWLAAREQKYIRDSIYKVVAQEFKVLYDSCVDSRHKMEQDDIDAKAPKRITQDSIKLRKQFIRDSIAARKDSIAREKAIKAGKPIPVGKYTAKEQKIKTAKASAEKAKAKQVANRDKAKIAAIKAKAAKEKAKTVSGKTTTAASTTNNTRGNAKKEEDDSAVMSDKEAKKLLQQQKAERAKAAAERAKARIAAQREARKAGTKK